MYTTYFIFTFFMKAAQGIKNQKKCKPQTHLCKEHIEHLIRRFKKSNGGKKSPKLYSLLPFTDFELYSQKKTTNNIPWMEK